MQTVLYQYLYRKHELFGFQKNEYFLGYEDFVDIFLGSSQNWARLRVISMYFRDLF